MKAGKTLVLFDIDGTLLDVRGAGRASFVDALESVFGWRDPIEYINFAGATDLSVLERIFERHGRRLQPDDAARFFARLPSHLEERLRSVEPLVYPGVKPLLLRLETDPRVTLGLVTGNIEACARLKLARAGLLDHVSLGAFGCEHADRAEIARRALSRLRPPGDAGPLFLVGDTPSDIGAAHAIGAVAVAVATGRHEAEVLRDHGADLVFTDLSDPPAVLAALGL